MSRDLKKVWNWVRGRGDPGEGSEADECLAWLVGVAARGQCGWPASLPAPSRDSLAATCIGSTPETHRGSHHQASHHQASRPLLTAAHSRSTLRTYWNQEKRPLSVSVFLQCLYWQNWYLLTLQILYNIFCNILHYKYLYKYFSKILHYKYFFPKLLFVY